MLRQVLLKNIRKKCLLPVHFGSFQTRCSEEFGKVNMKFLQWSPFRATLYIADCRLYLFRDGSDENLQFSISEIKYTTCLTVYLFINSESHMLYTNM